MVLKGGFRIETSNGAGQDFTVGDIVLLADVSGTGHHTTMM